MNQWDAEGLWQKARAFFERANEIPDRSDSQYHLWSMMGLELLARSALARIHPVLNADFRGSDASILYAFGGPFAGARSAVASVIYSRLEALGTLSGEDAAFCKRMTEARNEDVHTAALPFDAMKESDWLPRLFEVCQVLSKPRSLKDLLGPDIGPDAEGLVTARKGEARKDVLDVVAQHRKEFADRGASARTLGINEQLTLMMRYRGLTLESAKCPACGNSGFLFGRPFRELAPHYQDGTLYTTTEFRSDRFECPSCELALGGLSAILNVDLPASFTGESTEEMLPVDRPEHDYGDM